LIPERDVPQPDCLWLKVQSDEFAVSVPQRFQRHIRLYPADRLVRMSEYVLGYGLFAGAARGCHLRLEQIPLPAPQFAIRYNQRFECRLMGWGAEVYYNGTELGERTVTLGIDDTIICDPYLLRVVPAPSELLQSLVEKLMSREVPGDSSSGSSDFRLKS
jgi:hypothetical protein